MLGRALSGFANAEGGVLVIGMKTAQMQSSTVDVASALAPSADAELVRNRIAGMVPEILDPELPGIAVYFIAEPSAGGFVVVDVPRSETRPHMSMKDHRYYRRDSQSTHIMAHREIRDLVLSINQASPTVETEVSCGKFEGWCLDIEVKIYLTNPSNVPLFAPFMSIRIPNRAANFNQPLRFNSKQSRNYRTVFADRTILMHRGDEEWICTATYRVYFGVSPDTLISASTAVKLLRDDGAGSIIISGDRSNSPVSDGIYPIELLIGGENATPTAYTIEFSKSELMDIAMRCLT